MIICRMLQPIVLANYINYFESTKDKLEGWMWATGVIVMAFINILVSHHCNKGCQRIGMRVRTACGSLVYRKVGLQLSTCAFRLMKLFADAEIESSIIG